MLAKDPSQRPTAAELVQALAAASTPQGLLSPLQVRRRRWKRGICLGLAVLGAVPMTAIDARIASQVMSFLMGGGEGADPTRRLGRRGSSSCGGRGQQSTRCIRT